MLQAGWLAILLLLLPAAARANETAPDLAPAELREVAVAQLGESTIVQIKTTGAAKYRAEFMDSPNRLVVDLEDTRYAWRKAPLSVGQEPVKQIRGSQYRRGVARVVVEFTRKVGYAIREDVDGLAIVIPTMTAAARMDSPVATPGSRTSALPSGPAAPASEPATPAEPATPPPAAEGAAVETNKPAVAPPLPSKPARVPAAPVAKPEGTTPRPAAPAQVAQVPAPKVTLTPVLPPPAQVAQAPATAPPPAPAAQQRLISLEFKDADVVNLLRILAVESGRNVVIGDDVKGKMSISLRNVPWELALETILESRGLQRLDKDGVTRIVSTEQLTKEREARARVEEAKIKGEAEARAKLAEAQVKEAEATTKKMQAEAAQREQEARGPLREETIRLSYADPEEVAGTLLGILGIPKEGTKKVEGPGYIAGPFPEPPFSQLFGPRPPTAEGPVSVSQDVLNKGLTIRAHKPTNTLFLRLYAADLDRVKKIIREALDVPLPQVKIEARMEILDRNALEQIGIQWGGFTASNIGKQTLVGQGLQTTQQSGQTVPFVPGFVQGTQTVIDPTTVQGLNPINPALTLLNTAGPPQQLGGLPVSFQTGLPLGGNLINLPISALPNAGPLPAAGLAFGFIGSRFNINIALQALASQGKTRTLARPEIVTVENNKATMSLGEELPYATISSAGTQIQFKEALLKLEVTPTVIREGDANRIKMVVIVENNSRGDTVNLGNAGSPPAINRRKAETQVLIKEGDRLVIGGVTTSTNQNTVRKVPVFGDIPLLGWLFKQRENFESGRELVVFLTPSVLKNDRPNTSATSQATPPAASSAATTPQR
jgi:type IV pilus assembly protein PilQ